VTAVSRLWLIEILLSRLMSEMRLELGRDPEMNQNKMVALYSFVRGGVIALLIKCIILLGDFSKFQVLRTFEDQFCKQ
jgi:hypothetical protein